MVAYSSLNWADIKPVFEPLIQRVQIPHTNIQEEALKDLHSNLIVISRAVVQGSKEAKRIIFIGAILFHLVQIIDKLDNQTQDQYSGRRICGWARNKR